MSRISRETLAVSSMNGVKAAFKKYYEMSGGEWLCSAPESLLQAEIAHSLIKAGCTFVTMEDTIRYIKEESGHSMRGRLPRYSPTGRVDIIVWRSDNKPVCLIEVKKSYHRVSITDDVKRLRQMVNTSGSIHTGIVVSYTAAKRYEKVSQRFQLMANVSGSSLIFEPLIAKKEDWHWGVGCFFVN